MTVSQTTRRTNKEGLAAPLSSTNGHAHAKVDAEQRYTAEHTCPGCDSHQSASDECKGILLSDGKHFTCTNKALGEYLPPFEPKSGNAALIPHERKHSLTKPCACLKEHARWEKSGLALAEYGEAKGLPVDWLEDHGSFDVKLGAKRQQDAVGYHYHDLIGNILGTQYRLAMSGAGRFKWKDGTLLRALLPYGAFWAVPLAQKLGYLVVAEGVSCSQTGLYHDLPVIGVPGGSTWQHVWDKPIILDLIAAVPDLRVYVIDEHDSPASEALVHAWDDVPEIREHVHTIGLKPRFGVKDISDLYLKDREHLRENFRVAMDEAVSWKARQQKAREQKLAELRAQAAPVFEAEDPVASIMNQWLKRGWGGDDKLPTLVYAQATTRLLPKNPEQPPAHGQLVGPAGTGKSWLLAVVCGLLPDEVVVTYDATSQRVLIHDPVSFKHKLIVYSEADSLPGIAKGDEENPAASMIRTLLQRGDAIYTVTVKDPKTGQMTVKKIVKEGPACLITTGVTELKGEQLGSRIPALEVPDDPNQQKEALKAFARSELQGPAPAPDPALIAMQRYLQLQAPIDVIVPYVDTLTERLSSRIDSRLLRHTAWLMALIKGIAILRSARRERDEHGRIKATLADYETVAKLVEDVYETTATVSAKVRELVDKTPEAPETTSQTKLAEKLHISKQAVSKRVHTALAKGWIVNIEHRRGRRAQLQRGEPLPYKCSLPTLQPRTPVVLS